MTPYSLRKALIEDIPEILILEKEDIDSWNENQFREEVEKDNSLFYVIEHDSEIAAYIVTWIVYDELHLNSISVSRKFRRQGYGKLLIDHIISIIKPVSIYKIILEVRNKNTAAINFYEKMHFTKIGLRKKYYSDDDALIMEKIIK